MSHNSKVTRFLNRTKPIKFKLKRTQNKIGKREKFRSFESIEKFTIDTDNEKLFQQKQAKTRGRVRSFKFPKNLIKPLNIRKTFEFNFPSLFRGNKNV